MKTVFEVFGSESRRTHVNLNWAGRAEPVSHTADRLSATMAMLSKWTGFSWYRDTEDLQSRKSHFELVPADSKSLSGLLVPGDEHNEEAASFFMSLIRDPATPSVATLSGSVGLRIDQENNVKLRLGEDFPMGSPSEAAVWFLDLVRIWQPDRAVLSNSAAQMVTGLRRSAYLSWTSSKAYEEPNSNAEIDIEFGDGNLRAARVWSVEGIGALDNELKNAGAPEYDERPAVQDTPQFPDGYPAGLEILDHEVIWAR